ncbi:MAG: hypothetical protein IKH30_10415 [Clostridia bacterium]|nr:hypothetical protein [Clostridia bacterium]
MIAYGLIGERLGHSYSPRIHRFFGDYDYQLYPMPLTDMEALLRGKQFQGLNVTIPYKQAVLPFCDELSPSVRAIGSANTLVNRDGRIYAYNTDLAGMLSMLDRAGIGLTGRKVVILGSGGTSLTAQAACRERKAKETVVVSRKGPVTYNDLYTKHTDAEVIINATPVGMYPNNMVSPIDLNRFPRIKGVADVIYNPAKTKLLLDAEAAGIPCIDGLWMLVAQAWHAATLFLDTEIPEEKIQEAFQSVRRECLNLVLMGMPGCGKSTQSRLAAEKLNRPFVDLDAEIVKRHGPIPRIFEEQGEAGFRVLESEIVREYGKESGLVIATGGGAVLREENIRALRQNGVICWLRRPIEKLATQGRPLSVNQEKLREMEKTRLPLYRACADYSVDSQEQRTLTAQKIVEGFYEAAGAERAEPEHAGHSGEASVRNPDL